MATATISLHAQVLVDLSFKRAIYVAYEPLLATVHIKNLSGNRLLLADVDGKKWFGFHIETLDGRPIPPSDPDYQIPPIQIEAGDSITRTINLTQLYPISDLGSYRVSATVYATELSGYFSSPPLTVEISEGRLLWQQNVGVPDTPEGTTGARTVSLLTFRLPEKTDLYLRIEDKSAGIVYCTHRLGDFINYGNPDVMLDAQNNIYVLQNTAPHEFVFSEVALDGKILERSSYQASNKVRPRLRRATDGSIAVQGGVFFDPHAPPPAIPTPKLSDRPLALTALTPTPAPTPHGKAKKPTPKKSAPSLHPSTSPVQVD